MSYNSGNDFSPTTDLEIETILYGSSLAATQNPTGLGEANSIQLEFGVAVNTGSDPVQLSAAGALQINDAGTYRLKVATIYGRTGGGGVSELRLRALLNGAQLGRTVGVEVDNANTNLIAADEAWLSLVATDLLTFELMRDSSGTDSGGLIQPVVTAGTAPDWNPSPCAIIQVDRWKHA